MADSSDVLDRVEVILAQLGRPRRPGSHFREVSLGQGRLLSVDVFQSGSRAWFPVTERSCDP